jgi:hypothetical protein
VGVQTGGTERRGTFGFSVDLVVYPHPTSMWGHGCAGRWVERLGQLQLCKWLLARDNVADWLGVTRNGNFCSEEAGLSALLLQTRDLGSP